MNLPWRLIRNAMANLGRGSAMALVALLLPAVLVRHMAATDYAIWVLILQCAAYVSYLDFGLQTAVGRYIAFTTERKNPEERNVFFSTAVTGLTIAAALSVVLLLVAIGVLPRLFPGVPQSAVPQMRCGLLIVGLSAVLGLPASAWNGVFVGLSRYEIPALTQGGARLLGGVGLIVVALAGGRLTTMATVWAGAIVASYAVQYFVLRRIVPQIRFAFGQVRRSAARELSGYCFGLTVMSFSMLLVTGFDLILVGRFDFDAVVPYSVAATLVTFATGAVSAIVSVLMPHAAALHAQNDAKRLGGLVITSTRWVVLLVTFVCIPPLIYAGPLLRVWVGQRFVDAGRPILVILLIANLIRLIGLPYATVLVSAAQQRFIKIAPLTEGISNLLMSILLGYFMGALGVALGTLAGSVLGIAAHLLYSIPRTRREIDFSPRECTWWAVVAPFFCCTPLLLAAVLSIAGGVLGTAAFAGILMVSLAASISLLYRTGDLRGSIAQLAHTSEPEMSRTR